VIGQELFHGRSVGVTTSGWEPRSYCVTLAGNAFGFAINSGRLAAENAVKYINVGKNAVSSKKNTRR
jgi:hypothetical protein